MRTGHTQSHLKRAVTSMRIAATGALLGKMKMWGAMIDCKESPTASDDHILAFNRNCETLLGYLKILYKRSDSYARNPLISQTQHNSSTMSAPSLCESLAKEYSVNTINGIFASIRDELGDIDEQLCELLENSPEADGDDPNSRFAENTEVSDFYVYIGLQSAILSSIDHAREALVDINWQQLRETRF